MASCRRALPSGRRSGASWATWSRPAANSRLRAMPSASSLFMVYRAGNYPHVKSTNEAAETPPKPWVAIRSRAENEYQGGGSARVQAAVAASGKSITTRHSLTWSDMVTLLRNPVHLRTRSYTLRMSNGQVRVRGMFADAITDPDLEQLAESLRQEGFNATAEPARGPEALAAWGLVGIILDHAADAA
jgi:hypothetical protein